MDVKKISDDVRLNEWMLTISTCRESGLSVRKWCQLNNVNEARYYYWLKRIRKMALEESGITENDIVELPPVKCEHVRSEPDSSFVTLYKGETKIEIPYDCPEHMVALLMKQLC